MSKQTGNKKNITQVINELNESLSKDRLKGYFGKPVHAEKIELFEKAFGVRLPASFKLFLRNFDGGFIADRELDLMIMAGEFEEAEWNSNRFLSIDQIIDEYEKLDLDDWKIEGGFEGFYPYIPFAVTADGEKLVFVDNTLQKEEPMVFLALHDAPASGWYAVAGNFTEFLTGYFNSGGFPDLYAYDSELTAEDFIGPLNGRKEEKDDPREIIKRATAYLELFPGSAITFIERANAFSITKQYEAALADYNKSIELDPKLAFAYYCRGDLFLSMKKARQALIDFDSACTLEPDDPLYLSGRADSFLALNKPDKALADCNRVLDIDNNYFSALSTRYDVYLALGETEKADADARRMDELLAED